MTVLDEGVAQQDIAVSEVVGADWCCWVGNALNAGGGFDVGAEIAFGLSTAAADWTVSGTGI